MGVAAESKEKDGSKAIRKRSDEPSRVGECVPQTAERLKLTESFVAGSESAFADSSAMATSTMALVTSLRTLNMVEWKAGLTNSTPRTTGKILRVHLDISYLLVSSLTNE